ncbi:MAG: YkgJ family cysteine cluster protein [Alphaproteobacteria bacterium]|nr:YkgJ family cysteine cluster protein [Alphaproteobacteria bacterium]
MGEAKRRRLAEQKLLAARPMRASAAEHDLGSSLSDQERAATLALSQAARQATRESLRSARSASGAERIGFVQMIAQGSAFGFEHHIKKCMESSPENRKAFETVACKAGCHFCCHVNVAATIPEAIFVAGAIRQKDMKDAEAAVKATAPCIANLDNARRQAKRIPCPMLQNGLCSIYPFRPMACRSHVSMNADECRDDLESMASTGSGRPITTLGVPRTIARALHHGVAQGCADEKIQGCTIELTAAVNLLLSDAAAVERWLEGEKVFEPL